MGKSGAEKASWKEKAWEKKKKNIKSNNNSNCIVLRRYDLLFVAPRFCRVYWVFRVGGLSATGRVDGRVVLFLRATSIRGDCPKYTRAVGQFCSRPLTI